MRDHIHLSLFYLLFVSLLPLVWTGVQAQDLPDAEGPEAMTLHSVDRITEWDGTIEAEELYRYSEAVIDIQQQQQNAQREMWMAVLNRNLNLEGFLRIDNFVRAGQPVEEMGLPDEVYTVYREVDREVVQIQIDLIDQMIVTIEEQKFDVDRFEELASEIREYPGLSRRAFIQMQQVTEQHREEQQQQVQDVSEIELDEDGQESAAEEVEVEPGQRDYIEHFTTDGERLWDLAELYYGDPLLWPEIFAYNYEAVPYPNLLPLGVVLKIPMEFMDAPPPPRLSVDQKRTIIANLLPFREFRELSFTYIVQQQEMRSEIDVHLSASAIQDQIQQTLELENQRVDPPDFLAFLIPVQETDEPADESENGGQVALDNLVMDETRTPFGQDFYDRFYNRVTFPDESGGFHIRVIERPTPGRGSQMVIEINNEVIYQFQLQPGYERIMEMAEAAARGIADYMINLDDYSDTYF